MSGISEGQTHASRELAGGMYLKTGDPGRDGGGTYSGGTETEGTMAQYENIFGPAGRDIKQDNQRHKRHQRWHLPDALKGHNQYLTDRVDGLITDATNSPFTRNILPYVYLENPDQKLKWNVYSFDEGIASRVPYEAAARVLPQTKRSFAGYTVRQGLAIAMEHNFMVSAAGRENFKNQLTQLVGSIQLTNDLDVHVALLQAPSYQKHMNEKYYDNTKTTAQMCRQYIDLFGILQKVPNAMDILIEDAKSNLQTWGSQPPTFVLCNSALTSQLTMLPEKTNFVTNGPDGLKRLAEGPNLSSYRGLQIIPSRKFSMDAGTAPRDLLRRRVRVAEYYRIPWQSDNVNRSYEFYDQSRDSMFTMSWNDLFQKSAIEGQSVYTGEQNASGFWTYDNVQMAKIPAIALNTFAPSTYPYGLTLRGRMAPFHAAMNTEGTASCRYLQMHGFSTSLDPDHDSNKRTMSITEVIADSKPFFPQDHEFIGVNGHVFDLNQDQPDSAMSKEVALLCEQSETGGQGIFSDPLSGMDASSVATRICTDFASLHQHGTCHDFMKHWMVVYFFHQLNAYFDDSCGSGNSKLIESVSGEGDPFARTPLCDMGCLGDEKKGVMPLFHHNRSSVGMELEYAYRTVTGRNYKIGAAVVAGAAVIDADMSDSNYEWHTRIVSLDGDLSHDRFVRNRLGTKYWSRKEFIDAMTTVYHTVCKDEQFLAHMKSADAKDNIRNTTLWAIPDRALHLGGSGAAGVALGAGMLQPTNESYFHVNFVTEQDMLQSFEDFQRDASLFFMWVLSTDWTGGAPAHVEYEAACVRRGVAFVPETMEMMQGFRGTQNDASLRHSTSVLLMSFAADRDISNHSKQKEFGDVLRCVHNLQHKFDVPNIGVDNAAHGDTIDIMITASQAFVKYRQSLQEMAHIASYDPTCRHSKEDANTLAVALKHNALTAECSTADFKTSVVREFIEANRPYLNTTGFGNRVIHPGYNRNENARDANGNNVVTAPLRTTAYLAAIALGGVALDLLPPEHKAIPYFDGLYKTFKTEMAGEHTNVKQTHNIVMTTSESAGANITHFPNFHISRCTPLCEDDRKSSASSDDDATWILQGLAGMMPLNAATCKNMMGYSDRKDHTTVLLSSEMLSGATTAADLMKHPSSVIAEGVTGAVANNTYDSRVATPGTATTPWASQQYSTRLMQTFMSVFNPNTYVYATTVQKSLIPDHRKKKIMLAFAGAIEANKTMTPDLMEVLRSIFPDPEGDNHVPVCPSQGSEHIKFVPICAESREDFHTKLKNPIPWRDVPFSVDFDSGPSHTNVGVREMEADLRARRSRVMLWDAHKNDGAHGDRVWWASVNMYESLSTVFPMRSFEMCDDKNPAPLTTASDSRKIHDGLSRAAVEAAAFCRNFDNWEVFWKHVLLVLVSRFFRASTRFADNGKGMIATALTPGTPGAKYFPNGMHLMHGSRVPVFGSDPGVAKRFGDQCDLVVLRPNIEHEMLGVIMGRGGTQELGATFWGQTELSCYDDAQHGIWGMSYKYHERAMVTNERNMIRAYDVAFDGYNGGMDQTCVDWDDPESLKRFRDSTYDRTKPFSGPSMLVMALPVSGASSQPWPNPIVYHADVNSAYSPDPEKSQGATPNLGEHVVFNHEMNSKMCSRAVQDKFAHYMTKLQMTQWINADQSNRPAGEACIANEASSSPMAFQGSMRVLNKHGAQIEDIKGSGHLGHSYVGIASVREGRGVLNPAAQHSMMRLV